MKFSIKDFLSNCDQIRIFLWIWPHLLKKSLIENFIFCAVLVSDIWVCPKLYEIVSQHFLNNGWSLEVGFCM